MSSLFPSRPAGGLRFTLFGVPVTISLSVVLLLAFLGFPLGDPVRVVLWVAIGILSILLHELGHAVAARTAGATPEIALAGLGGATTYRSSARTESRGWSLAIGLAGPAVGIVLGLAAVALGAPCCGVAGNAPVGEFALSVFVFVSLVWSVLNLLPILPLDGGQALASLLPGDRRRRQARAAGVGAVVGTLVTVVAVMGRAMFAAIVVGLLTWQNIQTWRDARHPPEDGGPGATGAGDPGDLKAARDALAAGHGDEEDAAAVQRRAYADGSYQLAAEVGEIALLRGATSPRFAYDAARAWARLGMVERAVATLERAFELGFDEREELLDEPAFGPLRDHPRWTELTRTR